MQPLKWHHLRIDLVGGKALHDPQVLAHVLDAFEIPGIEPTSWSVGEPPGRPYARDEVHRMVLGQTATAVALHREPTPAYHATLFGRHRPRILIQVSPPTRPHHDTIVALAQALVAAVQPEIGWLHPLIDAEPPFADEVTATRFQMDDGCDGAVSTFDEHGPGGLGAYTWMSEAMVAVIGRERLAQAPIDVYQLPHAGVRVELVDNPLDADDARLAAAWTKAMNVLAGAEFFARPTVDADGYTDFERGSRFDLAFVFPP